MSNTINRPGTAKSETVAQLPMACADENAAVEFLENQRWGDTPTCAHCESENIYQMKDRSGGRNKRFLWKCNDCKKQHTVRVGTVFEESRIPLRHWCLGFWRACSSKKGVSAMQIQRETGLSYKSALFMMHRIRFAMTNDNGTPFTGTVEVDETYVGGKPRYKGANGTGRGTKKTPVVAIVERGGDVRAKSMRLTGANLFGFMRENMSLKARLVTDEFKIYRGIGRTFEGGHDAIYHGKKEFTRGDVHTNTVEGFFSLLKRGLYGTFHSVSKHHLDRYIAEFTFRYNTRQMDDGERITTAIKQSLGKRLIYA